MSRNVTESEFIYNDQYRCIITDANGNTVTSDAAQVLSRPLTITTQPENVVADVGDNVSFTVKASGGKAPYSYRWQFRYIPSGSTVYTGWGDVGDVSWATGSSSDTLTITAYKADFTGKYQYQCIITDANGDSVTTDSAQLLPKPLRITSQPQSVTGDVNTAVSFSVTAADGLSPYTYSWQYRYISSSTGAYTDWKDIGSSPWAQNADTRTLSFTASSADFSAKWQYRCVVTDVDGRYVISNAVSVIKNT